MARIRKHRSKWQVLYRDPATKKERSAGVFDRKSDATKQRRAVEYRLQTGEWIDPKRQATRYADWAKTWIEARSDLEQNTRDNYLSLLQSRIIPKFGEWRLQDIRTIDIEEWVAKMFNEPLSPSRVRQAFNVLSSSLKAAVRSDMLRTNPAYGVKLPRVIVNEMHHLTPSQVDFVGSRVGDEHATFIYVLAYCTIRAGEAVALRRRNVNIVRSELRILESASENSGRIMFGPTKSGRRRDVTVPKFLMKRIAAIWTVSVRTLRPSYLHHRKVDRSVCRTSDVAFGTRQLKELSWRA